MPHRGRFGHGEYDGNDAGLTQMGHFGDIWDIGNPERKRLMNGSNGSSGTRETGNKGTKRTIGTDHFREQERMRGLGHPLVAVGSRGTGP